MVEDNLLDAELAMDSLREGGLSNPIIWLRDGEDAVDYVFREGKYAARGREQPCLILLDLNLPRTNGVEVLAILKADERTQQIPVAVMTSSTQVGDVLMAGELGANGYITKPVDCDGLKSAMEQLGLLRTR